MSVNAIVSSSPAQATDNNAKVQLQRDLQKLAADTKAKASQAQLAADNIAIANDQIAVAAAVTSRVDTYL